MFDEDIFFIAFSFFVLISVTGRQTINPGNKTPDYKKNNPSLFLNISHSTYYIKICILSL